MTEWREVALGEVCKSIEDGDWIETKDQGGSDFRLLQVSNIGLGSFRETGKYRYVTRETFNRLRCHEILPGMVLVARMPDPVGRAWYVDRLHEPAITAVDVAIVDPDPSQLDGRFCAHLLNSPRQLAHAAAVAGGTTRLRITRKQLAAFRFRLPDLPYQQEVSRVLTWFDDLIENNRRRVKVLEEMARTIYREWFVHFRYPGHAAFPLVDSPLGPVPTGWQVCVSGDLQKKGILEIGDGYRAKNSEMSSGELGLPFVRVANVRDGHLSLAGADQLPMEYVDRLRSKVSQIGDVVISMKGTVGRQALVDESHPRMAYSPQVSFWRSLDPHLLSPAFLYQWIRSEDFSKQCAAVKGATDMADYVNLTDQRRMLLALPPQHVMSEFDASASPIRQMIGRLQAQSAALAGARDVLLPKLVTGQIDVANLDLDELVEVVSA